MANKPMVPVVPGRKARGSGKLEARLAAPVKREGLRPLTAKEQKFVYELVSADGEVSMTEAAIRAGYSQTSARQTSQDLTNPAKYPHVVAAIQDYRAELNAKYGTTFEKHLRDLKRIRDAALEAGAFGAAVQAEYRRGQALGTIYVDRKEVRIGTIDSMSKDEVAQKLREIKAMFTGASRDIVDVDPVVLEHSVEREVLVEPEFDEGEVLRAGDSIVPATEDEPGGLPDDETGESGEPWGP